MSKPTSKDYVMNRVKINFPYKAYPSQLGMMNNVILALQRGQNALLESPTGSGKSLALLCAALAWQNAEYESVRQYNAAIEEQLIQSESQYVSEGSDLLSEEDILRMKSNSAEMELGDIVKDIQGNNIVKVQQPKKKTVPKIYFGTRTHKQIEQIVKELNKTIYKDAKMTILGSRDFTCIHPQVSKKKNITEACVELTDPRNGSGCSLQSHVKTKLSSHRAVNVLKGGEPCAWDLEDLVKIGKRVRACPYYASKELMAKSQIIFCPYNYLIEPKIRKTMNITLNNQIIILDEAHNIEDSAMSAAGWTFTEDDLIATINDLERMIKDDIEVQSHRAASKYFQNLGKCLKTLTEQLTYDGNESLSKLWRGSDMIGIFNNFEIGIEHFQELQEPLERIFAEWANSKSEWISNGDSNESRLTANTISFLEQYLLTIKNMFSYDMRFLNDYRVVLCQTQTRHNNSNSKMKNFASKMNFGTKITKTLSCNFWCLNPGVAFFELKEQIHSLILTSGTLSPMASFSSELDLLFPLKLEANHIIDKKQLWIGTTNKGPLGSNLCATYQHVSTFKFQDEIGEAVFGVCNKVQYGILLFLPSYSMQCKLIDRWRQTGMFDRLMEMKRVFIEPRKSEEFENCLSKYYQAIEDVSQNKEKYIDGALMIAVCRGKVSEGMNFSDNNARAVICVGIPFPNVKDLKVEQKKKYNDLRKKEVSNLLSGNDWYEIQAFRALNQALGRCIRHKNDWGAILLIDDRYQRNRRYIEGLSKWVRTNICQYSSFDSMLSSLEKFNDEMKDFTGKHEEDEVKISEEIKNDEVKIIEDDKILPSVDCDNAPSVQSVSFYQPNVKKSSSLNVEHKVLKSLQQIKQDIKTPLKSGSSTNSISTPQSSSKKSKSKSTNKPSKKPRITYINDSDDDFQ